MKVGFIGTGTITEAIVTGIAQSKLDVAALVVSPRNSTVAAKLAAKFPLVEVARDNQAVIDHTDIVFLAIRPQILRDVLRELRFRDGQRVIGLVAATHREQLLRWTGGRTHISQAIPLPFVADKMSPTVVYPPDLETMKIFDAIGGAIGVESLREYEAASAGSALMAVAAGVQETCVRWLSENGMAAAAARAYVSGLNFGIASSALTSPEIPLDDLRSHYSTVGGINEQCYAAFRDHGGVAALEAAMNAVLERVRATPFENSLEGEAP
ncbi:pyrroline-5-carboxylate reductase [Bradyrhizobium sp. USDA 10063]